MICPKCHRAISGAKLCPYDGAALSPKRRVELVTRGVSERDGERIGERYKVFGLLGEGTMAKVFLGEDERTGDAVAIKMMDREKSRRRDLEQLFMEEAAITERVTHPNIVATFDVGEHLDGSMYLVMELLTGESLGDRLKRRGVPRPRETVWIAREIARALSAAHDAGVVHRDIKPDNIFLHGAIDAPHAAKIVDFGLAHSRSSSVPNTGNFAIGTIKYMAPEQALGEMADARSDIYGLGAVLFRALTDRLPFLGADKVELLAKQVASPAPVPSLLRDGLDPDLDRIVLRALRKDPDNRYPSMAAFADDLDRFLGAFPIDFGGLANVPDRYRPRTPFGEQTARFLCQRIQIPYPGDLAPSV
jgi:eukaryotic-like serine/threonine-protein kinase